MDCVAEAKKMLAEVGDPDGVKAPYGISYRVAHAVITDLLAEVARLKAEKEKIIEEGGRIIYSIFAEEPLESGEYAHASICSGNRMQPPGTMNNGCVCLRSKKEALYRAEQLEREVDVLTLENKILDRVNQNLSAGMCIYPEALDASIEGANIECQWKLKADRLQHALDIMSEHGYNIQVYGDDEDEFGRYRSKMWIVRLDYAAPNGGGYGEGKTLLEAFEDAESDDNYWA